MSFLNVLIGCKTGIYNKKYDFKMSFYFQNKVLISYNF